MRKRLFLGVLVTIAVSFAVVVTTGAASSRPGAKSSAQVLPSSSCLPVVYHGSGKPKFLIASDLPLQGANRPQTTQMTKAIQFVLAGQGYKAGAYSVGYQACDDSTAQAGKWDAAKCTANARAYAADKSVIGVIGTFNSGCAKLVIPILNRAPNGPLAMITPANTYPGLTHAAPPITVAGEPGVYYPTGKRNYARVVATDDFQGPADALMAQKLGVKKVYVLTDNETYGEGIAKAFLLAAQKLGMQIVGNEVWDPKASDYSALATKIAGSGAQGVFFGGIVCNNGAKLLKDLRAVLGPNPVFVGPDGWTPYSATLGAGSVLEHRVSDHQVAVLALGDVVGNLVPPRSEIKVVPTLTGRSHESDADLVDGQRVGLEAAAGLVGRDQAQPRLSLVGSDVHHGAAAPGEEPDPLGRTRPLATGSHPVDQPALDQLAEQQLRPTQAAAGQDDLLEL